MSGNPVSIYEASGSVGTVAVGLAKKANVGPLICVAGSGLDKVREEVGELQGDHVFDYRVGESRSSLHRQLILY